MNPQQVDNKIYFVKKSPTLQSLIPVRFIQYIVNLRNHDKIFLDHHVQPKSLERQELTKLSYFPNI